MIQRLTLRINKLALVLGILLVTLVLDQVTKVIAQDTLKGRPAISYAWDTFRLEYAENTGAFLGLGSGLGESIRFWVFGIGVALLLLWLTVHVIRKEMGMLRTVGLSLMISGGFGNLIDRLITGSGRVIDFMNMGVGPVRTGIFNVADVAIMVGIGLLLLETRNEHHKPGK